VAAAMRAAFGRASNAYLDDSKRRKDFAADRGWARGASTKNPSCTIKPCRAGRSIMPLGVNSPHDLSQAGDVRS